MLEKRKLFEPPHSNGFRCEVQGAHFHDIKYVCEKFCLGRTFISECCQAGLLGYVKCGERTLFTDEHLANFAKLIVEGRLRDANKIFLRRGIRKPRAKR